MKVRRQVDPETLAKELSGLTVLPGVAPWRSKTRALAKAITFVESDSLFATEILAHELFNSVEIKSWVIGLTGLPGAGKSSLTNLLLRDIRAQGKTVAVLAIDPSSSATGGAILGDRIRMQDHFRDEGIFIRSMGNRGALGGVARATRSAIRLASLLNFDYILVETVGIGQNESEIVDIADTTLLVLMPNSGDEIQLMKAGILQLADIYIVNKSDLSDPSRMMREIHENTAPSDLTQWCPPVLKSSVTRDEGSREILESIQTHQKFNKNSTELGILRRKRAQREVLINTLSILEPHLLKRIAEIHQDRIENIVNGKEPAMRLAKEFSELLLTQSKFLSQD